MPARSAPVELPCRTRHDVAEQPVGRAVAGHRDGVEDVAKRLVDAVDAIPDEVPHP